MYRYRVALLAVIAVAVIGVAIWLASTPRPSINSLEIQGPNVVNQWACEKYFAEFPQSSIPPATAAVSGTLGTIYSSQNCPAETPVSSVTVNLYNRRANLYFRSDTPGNAVIAAKAQGNLAQGGVFSFNGTRSIVIAVPTTVPACRWKQGEQPSTKPCAEICKHFKHDEFFGFFYVDIPYTGDRWGGAYEGCCPAGYQLYPGSTVGLSPEKLVCRQY